MSARDESSNSRLSSMLGLLPGLRRRKTDAVQHSEEEIQDWIIVRVSEKLDLDAADVDIGEPFSDYGLDSRTAVALSGDLERWLGLEISPTLVWDFPTIELVAAHLGQESAAKYGAKSAEPLGRETLLGGDTQ